MNQPTAKYREEAREIVREWAEHDMNEHYGSDYLRDEFGADHLEHRIASALSSRDAEIREVLEGLATHQIGSRRPCWCPLGYESEPHTPACLAARGLWERVQGE